MQLFSKQLQAAPVKGYGRFENTLKKGFKKGFKKEVKKRKAFFLWIKP